MGDLRSGFDHDPLELDRLDAQMLEQADTLAQQNGDQVDVDLVEQSAEAARLAAVARCESEGERDAATYTQAAEEDPETEPAEQWAPGAFDAWIEDEGDEAFAPLSLDEARACYVAALLRKLGGAS